MKDKLRKKVGNFIYLDLSSEMIEFYLYSGGISLFIVFINNIVFELIIRYLVTKLKKNYI